MTPPTALLAANHAFAALAADVDGEAPVRNEVWPTAGAMIDHLGNIQAWATEVVRTGAPADRGTYARPPGRERVEWFRQVSDSLAEALERADPDQACWTIWGADPVAAFWRRRMTHEAAKHLWDLRTAIASDPPMPAEIGLEDRAGIIDEFADLLVPAARARGIERLPRDLLLVADDLDRAWLFSADWEVTASAPTALPPRPDVDTLRADVGDLALFVWERADPWALPDRFRIDDGDAAVRAFSTTPVHL